MLSRRAALRTSLAAGLFSGVGLRAAFAQTPGDRRLVVVVLRGAMDGLSVVAPYGDPDYAPARAQLALAPGADALKLDGLFALHSALTHFAAAYAEGQALAVHAVATPERGRSHFDSQNVLETGGTAPYALSSGWLNRALALTPGVQAIAVTTAMPAVLQGPAKVGSWSPSHLPSADADTLTRIGRMYARDTPLRGAFEEAQSLNLLAQSAGDAAMAPSGPGKPLTAMAGIAAKMMAAPGGPQFIVLDRGGWDSHANQPGMLRVGLSDLDGAFEALKSGLGPIWALTAVLCVTEFGRTVATNGTNGTDHGTAGCALMIGGAVRGGRIITDWPGLAPGQRFEGRDLKPTTDLRAVIKGVLRDHAGIDPGRLSSTVFPGSQDVRALDGLVQT